MLIFTLQAPASVDRLRSQPASVYVTLSGHHTIGGNIAFQGPIKAQAAVVPKTLDGVEVDIDSLLLTTHDQTQTGFHLLLKISLREDILTHSFIHLKVKL